MFNSNIFGQCGCYIIQFDRNNYNAPNLVKILSDLKITKIFHFGRAGSSSY